MGETTPRLVRRLGLGATTAVVLGAMVGAGVYLSLGEAAVTTGASLLIALAIAALVASFNGLSSAELGATYSWAGGAYEFGRRLLRPSVGYLAGWLFILASLAAGSTFAHTFAAYLSALLPTASPRLFGLALIILATAVNARGVRLSSVANVALVTINIAALLALAGFTLPHFAAQRLQPLFSGSVPGLLRAAALMFFAYSGYARPVTVAEEVREPRRTLPRAVTAAITITACLYLLVGLAALGELGPRRLGEEQAPLRAVAAAAAGSTAQTLVSLTALIASTTVLLTEVWGLSRLVFAMARNGDLPRWLAELTPRERLPRRAVLVVGGAMLLLTLALDPRPALEASSLALLCYYGVMNLSATRLAPQERLYPRLVPIAGLAACVLLAFSLSRQTLLVVAATAVVGMAYYGVRRRT